MRFSLPTEQEIKNMVNGSHSTSGGSVLTKRELISKFEGLRKNKMGVREKIIDVVQRKCVEEASKDTVEKYLKWKD